MILLALAAGGVYGWTFWRDLAAFRNSPYGDDTEKVVEIPPGTTAHGVIRALARGGALSDERVAWWYVRFLKRDRRPFKAGEYAFTGPLRPDEVLERLYKGEVRLYRFTVPEGLRVDEIAEIVGRSGLAKEEAFSAAAHDPALARALALPLASLEGFLFPDTYTFAKGVTARGIVEAMVARFREEWMKADAFRKPGVDLDLGGAVTLASIIEKETGQPGERPRISCVFHNRLRLGMLLQTDPTVMYATMLRTGRWSKNITKADLLAPHPYNTYTTAGLPPGPIANAGAASLQAALAPDECKDLYFVSRNDGTHVFCSDLRCHEAAVREWQVDFFRRAHGGPAPTPGVAAPSSAPSAARPRNAAR